MAPPATTPTVHERTARTYLDHYLPPAQRDTALREALDEARYWGDVDVDDVVRCARRSLLARTHPAPTDEAAVLVVRCGLDTPWVAAITGLDEPAVRAAADDLVTSERPTPGARAQLASFAESLRREATTLRGQAGRMWRDATALVRRQDEAKLIRGGIAVLLAVAVLSAVGLLALRGGDPGPGPAAGFEIAAVTIASDPADGDPGGALPAGERAFVTVAYSPGGRDVNVDLTVHGPGDVRLIDAEVRLPQVRDRVVIPVPGRLLEEPGDYRVVVARDDAALAEESFTVSD